MFIDKGKFKKLVKLDYEGMGIRISKSDEGMFQIAGSGWIIEIDEKKMTKEVKGNLIETCGDIPACGCECRYKKGQETEREELEDNQDNMYLWGRLEKEYEQVTNTRLVVKAGRATMQVWQTASMGHFYMKDYHADIINAMKCENDEPMPQGPVKSDDMVIWYNDEMAVGIFTEHMYYKGERDVLAVFDGKDLNWHEITENAI